MPVPHVRALVRDVVRETQAVLEDHQRAAVVPPADAQTPCGEVGWRQARSRQVCDVWMCGKPTENGGANECAETMSESGPGSATAQSARAPATHTAVHTRCMKRPITDERETNTKQKRREVVQTRKKNSQTQSEKQRRVLDLALSRENWKQEKDKNGGNTHTELCFAQKSGQHVTLVPAAETKNKVKSALLLDVIVCKGVTILKLLSSKDEALLVRGNALLVLDLRLHVVNAVTRLNLERDSLAGQSLHEDLHAASRMPFLVFLMFFSRVFEELLNEKVERKKKRNNDGESVCSKAPATAIQIGSCDGCTNCNSHTANGGFPIFPHRACGYGTNASSRSHNFVLVFQSEKTQLLSPAAQSTTCLTHTEARAMPGQVVTLLFSSPYPDNQSIFDASTEEAPSDVDVVLPGVPNHLSLHRSILRARSATLNELLGRKNVREVRYHGWPRRAIWTPVIKDPADTQRLITVLQFCYGKDLCLSPKEAPHVLVWAGFLQLAIMPLLTGYLEQVPQAVPSKEEPEDALVMHRCQESDKEDSKWAELAEVAKKKLKRGCVQMHWDHVVEALTDAISH